MVVNGLTHFTPMFHLPPENVRKMNVLWGFQGVQKWNIGMKWAESIIKAGLYLSRILPFTELMVIYNLDKILYFWVSYTTFSLCEQLHTALLSTRSRWRLNPLRSKPTNRKSANHKTTWLKVHVTLRVGASRSKSWR